MTIHRYDYTPRKVGSRKWRPYSVTLGLARLVASTEGECLEYCEELNEERGWEQVHPSMTYEKEVGDRE